MGDVISICTEVDKEFSLREADALIPILIKLTNRNETVIEGLMKRQRYFLQSGAPKHRIEELDGKVCRELIKWGAKLTKLGCKVFGCGYVGFNNGFGYWSWKIEDGNQIGYYHGSSESPLIRKKLMRDPIL